ncbi:MAG: hypothetical protein BGP13_14830 [Sphingobacteriales bacterium 40-81]|nr:MAG: hypothetical protein BGP13_14830 [Sphingobacteriales bacterium 40-81]
MCSLHSGLFYMEYGLIYVEVLAEKKLILRRTKGLFDVISVDQTARKVISRHRSGEVTIYMLDQRE